MLSKRFAPCRVFFLLTMKDGFFRLVDLFWRCLVTIISLTSCRCWRQTRKRLLTVPRDACLPRPSIPFALLRDVAILVERIAPNLLSVTNLGGTLPKPPARLSLEKHPRIVGLPSRTL